MIEAWLVSYDDGDGIAYPEGAFDNKEAAIESFVDKGGSEYYRIDRIEITQNFVPCEHVFVLDLKHYYKPMMACEKCSILEDSYKENLARSEKSREEAIRCLAE